ncbi:hypothetical protein ABK905_04295 [Acerihabitans sp. KWT182]|uniref:Uncharacterized protein n=1 Tax=Acerihabitans sp. KWT182 TaxID=3157919 RepID=A0AAU7QBJ2_9GAMM
MTKPSALQARGSFILCGEITMISYSIFMGVIKDAALEENRSSDKVGPQGEKNTNTVDSVSAKMAKSLRAAGNTALKPFFGVKKLVFAVTQGVRAFVAKLSVPTKTKPASTLPTEADIKQTFTQEENVSVTPERVMQYLTDKGKSDLTGDHDDELTGNAKAVYDYFSKNPDSTLFSSENTRVKSINADKAKLCFKEPLVQGEKKDL